MAVQIALGLVTTLSALSGNQIDVVKTSESYNDNFVVAQNSVLSWQNWVLWRVKEAGFDPYIAKRVIQCESSWKIDVVHINLNGTKDVGLWQINDIHGLSIEERQDPYRATLYAIKLLKSSRSWGHWVCY